MRKTLVLALAWLVISCLVIGFAPALTQGADKDVEVVIGTHRDFTGPIAAVSVPLWKAFDWYKEWLEANDPIPGVKVKVLWEDTGYSAERYLPAYKRFKEAGSILQIHTSSTANSVLGELHRADKIPAITPGCGYTYGFFPKEIKAKGPSYLFFDRPPYADAFAGGAMHFLKKWKEAGHKEKPKAVFIGWDAPYPRGPIELATPYLIEQGFEMLQPQIYPVTATDLTSQCMALKKAGANLIMSNVTEKFISMLLKDARRAGMEFGLGPNKAVIMGGNEAVNPDVLKMAGDAAEGSWGVSSYPSFAQTELKGMKLVKELQMKHLGRIEEHSNYFMGMSYPHVIWKILKDTVKKYGKEHITAGNIYKSLTELKDYDMWGFTPNWTYGPDERRPFKKYHVLAVKGGKWIDMTPELIDLPWLTPDWEEAGLPGVKVKSK